LRKVAVCISLLAAVLAALGGCSSKLVVPVQLPAEDLNRKNPTGLNADSIKSGRDLYHSADCALCHGRQGNGKGFLAKDTRMNVHDWRDAAYNKSFTDGQLYSIIVKGKGTMPGYETRNTSDQIWLMVDYIRSLSMN
jgi:mono/diheme cytochrome c family protein